MGLFAFDGGCTGSERPGLLRGGGLDGWTAAMGDEPVWFGMS